jgi:hypothetical protein
MPGLANGAVAISAVATLTLPIPRDLASKEKGTAATDPERTASRASDKILL